MGHWPQYSSGPPAPAFTQPAMGSRAANRRPGGVHARGTRRASTAYPAKNRAFFALNRVAAQARRGAVTAMAGHVRGSRASYVRARLWNDTTPAPDRTRPATSEPRRHAPALTDVPEVVSQTRPPSSA